MKVVNVPSTSHYMKIRWEERFCKDSHWSKLNGKKVTSLGHIKSNVTSDLTKSCQKHIFPEKKLTSYFFIFFLMGFSWFIFFMRKGLFWKKVKCPRITQIKTGKSQGTERWQKWKIETEKKKKLKKLTYLNFLEQIIACHPWHTVVCYNKIHFHLL